MPLYEYQCDACGEHAELLQKFSDAPETECPHCHEPTLKRVISATNFHLKGTGWYVTDFKDQGKSPQASSTSSTKTTPLKETPESTKSSGDSTKEKE